jgi:CRISPR type I-E-associated protein CasB/Cse2
MNWNRAYGVAARMVATINGNPTMRGRFRSALGREDQEAIAARILLREGASDLSPWDIQCIGTVGAMMAFCKTNGVNAGAGNLGRSLRQIARMTPSVEIRFEKLTKSDKETLLSRLRPMARMLASKGVKINWAQLLYDMSIWDSEFRGLTHKAKLEWAEKFFG